MGGTVDYQLRYLGGAQVSSGDVAVELRTGRTAALLAYLAVTGAAHSRAQLAAFLWDDDSGAAATGNLRVLLSNLRRDVGALVRIDRRTVALDPDAVARVDVHRFEVAAGAALAASRTGGKEAAALLHHAIDLYRGDLLDGFEVAVSAPFELWLTTERARLRTVACEVLDRLVDLALEVSGAGDALALARRLAALDELREASAVRLVRAVAAASGRVAALRELRAYEELVARELGTGPGPALLALADELRAGTAPEAAPSSVAFTAGASAGAATPRRTRPLVGRRQELRSLEALVESGERLITIVGPGGVGKTSVAGELAHRLGGRAGAQVLFVDLTSLSDPALVAPALVAATGVVIRAGDRPEDSLVRGLSARRCILVLDNFEHLLGATDVVARIVDACAGVTVVVTTRVVLRVTAERVVELSPLPLPAGDRPIEILAADSVRLLLERSSAAGATLGDDPASLRALGRLCVLLDGLPLALELAAARLRTVDPADMLRLLAGDDRGQRLALLAAGPRDLPDRHRDLTAALAWSYDLLSDPARELLRAVSVIDGPFDLDAAAAVAGREVGPSLVECLTELVDASLVRPQRSVAGRSAFALLMVVRSFGRAELAARDEESVAQRRLVDHVLAVAGQARVGLSAPEAAGWSLLLAEDLPLVRGALDAAPITAAESLRILCDLGLYWLSSSDLYEAVGRFRHLLHGADDLDPLLVAEALLWADVLHHEIGGLDHDRARAVAGRARAAIDAGDDSSLALRCRWVLGHLLTIVADHDEADAVMAEGMSHAEQLGADWWWVEIAYQRAMLQQLHGDDDDAAALLRAVIPRAEALGNRKIVLYAWMLANQIGCAGEMGPPEPSLDELLERAEELGDHRYRVWIRVSLGTQAVLDGHLDAGAECFAAALEVADRAGYGIGVGFSVMGAVGVAGFRGDVATALELHGGIEEHLPALRHAMPRSFYEPYAALVDELERLAVGDRNVACRWEAGRQGGRERAVAIARVYLAPRSDRTSASVQA